MHGQSKPELIDRKGMEEWKASGSRDIYTRATDAARNILHTHQPEPLPEGVQKEIRSIIKETEAELGILKK
jgi:trimethylamine--corrinoid protein Co-methyltransferase